MARSKAATQRPRHFGICLLVALLAPLAALTLHVYAQNSQPAERIITIVMADGKTGKTMTPDNLVIRFNHLNAIRNETLSLGDDGSGKVKVPDNATVISVQGTYHNSVDIYVNCDAGMEKDTYTRHWYSVADIIKTGITTPNECYKGKYSKTAAIPPVPGELIFYVREIGWHESLVD